MSDANGWPDASKPGVPWKPIRAIYHYWMGDEFASEPTPFRWQPGLQSWRTGPAQDDNMTSEQMEAQGWRYLGPCLLAYEVNALVAKEREACAATAEREMRELFGDADEYQQGWNAGLEAGAAAIRARGDA
jgi:hypothetical protein